MGRKLFIIGIGAGDPDQITVQAIKAMERVDVFFLFDKGEAKSELIDLRTDLCARYASRKPHRFVSAESPRWSSKGPDYGRIVDDLNARKEELTRGLFERELGEGECGAILVWGDPALYDSTIRIVSAIADRPEARIDYEVIPGISSLQSLAARHRATWNEIGGSVAITTGRRLEEKLPEEDTVLVMLDARNAYLKHRGKDLEIAYGAYVGLPDEILIGGPLDEVAEEIATRREEARARKGWIMDSYLLRRMR